MNVEISEEIAEQLRALVACGDFDTIEAALEDAVRGSRQAEDEYKAFVNAKVERSLASAEAGRLRLLTRELADDIARRGEARRAAKAADARLPN